MAWKLNPFTCELDYYEATSGFLTKEAIAFTSADSDADGNYTLAHTRNTKDLIWRLKNHKDEFVECGVKALSNTQAIVYLWDPAISGTWKLLLA